MPVEVVSLPSIETFLLPRKGISASLPKGILIASFEEAALRDNVDFLQEPPPPLLFASRPITRLKTQQVPTGEVQSGTQVRRYATNQENYLIFLIYTDRNLGNEYGN